VLKGARMYCIREMEVIRVNAFWKPKNKGLLNTNQHFRGLTH